jgi:NAD(P)H-hydrate epimerase
VIPIGLSRDAINNNATPYIYLESEQVAPLLKKRGRFDHKGKYGHGLLIAGSFGKIGASVLGAHAALRGGIGLLTCHIPRCGYQIMQTAVPEAMVIPDKSDTCISESVDLNIFNAIGTGPGLGRSASTARVLKGILEESRVNMVLDADALNILSEHREWYNLLREGMILTPHPGEFERLAGESVNSFKRLIMQREFSARYNCIVVLKGAYTSVSLPGGEVYFNSTGNPGMATAGSGDVLTGIILSLLAQGYDAAGAAITGVFLHGLAGDIAAEETGYEALTSSDIIYNIGEAYKSLHQNNIS